MGESSGGSESVSSLDNTELVKETVVDRKSFIIRLSYTTFKNFFGVGADDDLRSAFFDPKKFERWWVERSNYNFAYSQNEQTDLFADVFTVQRREMSGVGRRVKKFRRDQIYEVVFKVNWDPCGLARVAVMHKTRLGFRTGPYTLRGPDSRLAPFDGSKRDMAQAIQQLPGDEDEDDAVEDIQSSRARFGGGRRYEREGTCESL